MKKILMLLLAVAVGVVFASSDALAISKNYKVKAKSGGDSTYHKEPAQKDAAGYEKGDFHKKVKVGDFPEKGWHKGPYVTANIGMMQATNDKHIVTGQKFDGSFDMAFGLSFGWDIADWIGPLFQINYATTTSSVGDPNNIAATVTYDGGVTTFPVGTFPVQNAREHIVDVSLFAKATLPYFTRASWQPKMVKILPYAKLGATGTALYVNASNAANKGGAFGGGPAVGLGCEFLIWKGFFVALDATEHLIIQKAFYKNITTTVGSQNFKVTESGFKPQFSLYGMLGWHF